MGLDDVKRVIVTGGCGFIGSELVNQLLAKYPQMGVFNIDKLTYASDENRVKTNGRYTLLEEDIALNTDLVPSIVPDLIIHLAAETHVDRSIKDNRQFVLTNVLGTQNLLDIANKYKIPLVYVSTDEIYGEAKEGDRGFVESDALRPRNPYSATKAAAEHLVQASFNTHGSLAAITRGSNTYGVGQFPEKLIPATIERLLRGAPAELYGDGEQIREWIHVSDHASGILWVAGLLASQSGVEHSKQLPVYNLGSSCRSSNLSTVRQLIDVGIAKGFWESGSISHITDRPGHDRGYAIDSSKILETGWAPSFSGGIKGPLDEQTVVDMIRSQCDKIGV